MRQARRCAGWASRRALGARHGTRACWARAAREAGGTAWARSGARSIVGAGALSAQEGARAGAAESWASGRAGAGRSEHGAQQAHGSKHGRRAAEARALGARPRRAGWPGLCTICIRPVFGSV